MSLLNQLSILIQRHEFILGTFFSRKNLTKLIISMIFIESNNFLNERCAMTIYYNFPKL